MFWVSPSVLLQLLPTRTHCMYYCAHWHRTFDSINALQAFLCFWLGFSEILKHNVLGHQSISLDTVASDEDPLYVLLCALASDIRQYYRFASFLSHAKTFHSTKHSFVYYIRVRSGSKRFANVKRERERERERPCMPILSGKSK